MLAVCSLLSITRCFSVVDAPRIEECRMRWGWQGSYFRRWEPRVAKALRALHSSVLLWNMFVTSALSTTSIHHEIVCHA
jgi:hypothetical protein